MNRYIYPKFYSLYHFIIRIRGCGLANCIIVYARALILAKKYNLPIINPSWVQLSLGPYLRGDKDKRHYIGLFKSFGISHIKKNWLLLTKKRLEEDDALTNEKDGIIYVEGLKNYFADVHNQSNFIREHLLSIVNEATLRSYTQLTESFIGVHIRLGDFAPEVRTSLDWYLEKMKFIVGHCDPKAKFFIFSDGTPDELKQILDFENTELAFFGNAMADILALSKAKLILASHSTFSACGAYLGQVPIVFNKRNFSPVLDNPNFEWVDNQMSEEVVAKGIKSVF